MAPSSTHYQNEALINHQNNKQYYTLVLKRKLHKNPNKTTTIILIRKEIRIKHENKFDQLN